MNILKRILKSGSKFFTLHSSLFTYFRRRKASRANIAWLKTVAQQHQWLDQLRTAGLLQWDVVQRRLYIEADLAVLFMQSADRWTAFIHNTYQWLYYQECQRTVEDYFHQQELKAVRDALQASVPSGSPAGANGDGSSRDSAAFTQEPSPKSKLTRADIDRIRRHRRAEIMQSDVPVPQVEPFEFFIVRPEAVTAAADNHRASPSRSREGNATGRLVAVGHYDPATDDMEIAPWSDVAPLLQQQK